MSEKSKSALLKTCLSPRETGLLLTGAIRAGDESRLRELLAWGLDPDSEAIDDHWKGLGVSLLAQEACSMSEGCLDALLDAGADPNGLNAMMTPALEQIIGGLSFGDGWQQSSEGAVEKVRSLLRKGARPNPLGQESSPLESAIRASKRFPTMALEITRELLRAGADGRAVFKMGQYQSMTALMLACEMDSLELVGALLESGADPRQENEIEWSALTIMRYKMDHPTMLGDNGEAIMGALISAMERLEMKEQINGPEQKGRGIRV